MSTVDIEGKALHTARYHSNERAMGNITKIIFHLNLIAVYVKVVKATPERNREKECVRNRGG